MPTHLKHEFYQPLANELLIVIIHQCQGDQQTLHALSLVNTMFRAESRPLLYQQLTSSQPKSHTIFIDILIGQQPHLIKLITKYDSSNIEHMPQTLWTSMMDLIAQMDNLQELGLRISDRDYHGAQHPFRPVTTGWNSSSLIPETPRFKLQSLRLRRKTVNILGVGWWIDLIRAHAATLEYLDMSEIKGVTPMTDDRELSYPKLKVVKGEWDVIIGLLPGKHLRVIDITANNRIFDISSILLELSLLEGFSSRYVCGMSKGKPRDFLEMVSRLDNVKYLGIAHELRDLSFIDRMLKRLPKSGLECLQTITLLWSNDSQLWDERYYYNIEEAKFMIFFKMCPSLRFIDIELPPRKGPDHVNKPYLALYHRIESRNPGQMHRYRFYSFQPDAVLVVQRVVRTRHTFHFE